MSKAQREQLGHWWPLRLRHWLESMLVLRNWLLSLLLLAAVLAVAVVKREEAILETQDQWQDVGTSYLARVTMQVTALASVVWHPREERARQHYPVSPVP